MKKLTIVGCLVAFAIAGLFLWQHFNHPRGAQVRAMEPGSWVEVWGDGKHPNRDTTNIVGADGRYLRHIRYYKSGSIIEQAGVLQVSNRVLIDTVTKDSRPDCPAPVTYQGRITKSDSSEIVAEFEAVIVGAAEWVKM